MNWMSESLTPSYLRDVTGERRRDRTALEVGDARGAEFHRRRRSVVKVYVRGGGRMRLEIYI